MKTAISSITIAAGFALAGVASAAQAGDGLGRADSDIAAYVRIYDQAVAGNRVAARNLDVLARLMPADALQRAKETAAFAHGLRVAQGNRAAVMADAHATSAE